MVAPKRRDPVLDLLRLSAGTHEDTASTAAAEISHLEWF